MCILGRGDDTLISFQKRLGAFQVSLGTALAHGCSFLGCGSQEDLQEASTVGAQRKGPARQKRKLSVRGIEGTSLTVYIYTYIYTYNYTNFCTSKKPQRPPTLRLPWLVG
jgi:hypothetical protein